MSPEHEDSKPERPISYYWIRAGDRHPVACVAYREVEGGGAVEWAISVWDRGLTWKGDQPRAKSLWAQRLPFAADPFSRKLGRQIAAGRLNKPDLVGVAPDLSGILRQVEDTVTLPPRVRLAAHNILKREAFVATRKMLEQAPS